MIDPRRALRGLLRILGQDTPADASTSRLTGVTDKPTITNKFEMGPETAQYWADQILNNAKGSTPAYQDEGVKHKNTSITLPDGSYTVSKRTSTPVTATARELHGPGFSDIAFQSEHAGYNQAEVKDFKKYMTESFPKNSEARFIQDYRQNRLQPAGLRAALGRQLNDIAIGKDVGWSAAEMDGKGRAREQLYMRATKGMFAIPPEMKSAVSRKVGTDKWLPHKYEDDLINTERKVKGRNQDKHGVVKFNPSDLFKDLKKLGNSKVTRYILGQLGKRNGLRVHPVISAYLDLEGTYRDFTKSEENPEGRSMTKDMADKLKPQMNRLNLRVPGMAFR